MLRSSISSTRAVSSEYRNADATLTRLFPRPVGDGAQSVYWHAKGEPASSLARTFWGVSLCVQLFQRRV